MSSNENDAISFFWQRQILILIKDIEKAIRNLEEKTGTVYSDSD